MVGKDYDAQQFDFAKKVKKTNASNRLECHNSLCESRNNCANYYGKQEGAFTIKRDSCRIYQPKEKRYVGKNK